MNKHKFSIHYTHVVREDSWFECEADDSEDAMKQFEEYASVLDDEEVVKVTDEGPLPLEKDPNQPELFEDTV